MRSTFATLLRSGLLASASAGLVVSSAGAQTNVLTWHNDSARTGQNLNEAILSPANVNASSFGLLANVLVDGKVDAQPLYLSAQTIAGMGTHNVLYVATEHDSVYAVDADSGVVLWQKSMLGANETTSDDRNCNQVTPEIGITATPAIDPHAGPNGTIYIVAMSKNSAGTYFQRIHALDLSSGAEQTNSPVDVHATYPGSGDGSSNGVVTFDPKQYKERPGLLLQNGQLYTSWGSHCDIRPYGGWLLTSNPTTLAQTAALDFVPNGSDAAPWNAGAGPAGDAAGNVYLALGNGTFDTQLTNSGFPAEGDFGNAMVKVGFLNGGLGVTDYWTMYNSNPESDVDTDLGSGGLMLLPDFRDANGNVKQLAVVAGKDHNIYVADRNNMGKFDPNSNATLFQELTGALPGGEWSSPAYFNGHVYFGSVGQNLRSFTVGASGLAAAPVQTSAASFGYPGTTPSVSAYNTGNGIVWATENSTPVVLHAYDANNLSTELYNSRQAPNGRDLFGAGNKFIAPTIANGKVYVGTQNSVGIFGLLRQQPALIPDGVYTLLNHGSYLLMDDPGQSTAPNTAIWQYPPNGGYPNQKWFFSYNGSGYYTIQNVASGLFLSDTTTVENTPLYQQLPTQDATQLWAVVPSGTGYLIQNKATGLVIDDRGWDLNPGQTMIVWHATGTMNQLWTLQ